ncbi:unnamed protein product [Mytilus coruscus]|uniref:B box-type domain-containing protein n=1 Tax=Mytilus coruscus TaxID=42192 RepID=A0A6J8AM37_MYTCO|nr:unnamed protein product [Mytilus coruscus]
MCTPCMFRNESMTPIYWCMVCKEGLCKYCSNYHKSSKALKRHDIISYKNRRSIPIFAQSIQETCFEHGRQLEFFCCVHQDFHCITCNTLDHKSCDSVMPLEDVVRNAKSSVAFCRIEEGLNVLLSKLEMILNKSEESITINEAQINEIRSDVNQIKNRICKKLEEDIREFLWKLDKLKSDSKTKAHETIRGLKEKLNVILDLKANVALLKENGTDLQIYLCLNHLESNITKEENNLSANINNGHYESEELMFRPSDAINTLKLVGSIGEIEVQQKPLKVNSGGMSQSVKVVKSTKESMSYRTDEIYLPPDSPRTTIVRIISICGIVLMAYADDTGGKSLFASTSSTLSAENWKSKSIGKILLLLMYFPLLAENVDSSSWIRLSFGLCLIVSNTVGYRINISTVLMIVWLLFGNFPFAYQRHSYYFYIMWYEKWSYFSLINTIVITGGFLLKLAYGYENTDLKKKA